MKCSLCGNENIGGKFCTSCGAKLPEIVDIPQEQKDEILKPAEEAGAAVEEGMSEAGTAGEDAVYEAEATSGEAVSYSEDVTGTTPEEDILNSAAGFSDAVDEAFAGMKDSDTKDEEDPASNYYDAGYSTDNSDSSGTYTGSIPPYDDNYAVGGGNIGFSIAALACGCLSILCCCAGCVSAPLSIAAIVCGVMTIKKDYDGRGMALAGIITAGIGLLLQIIFTIYALSEM